MDTRVPPAVGAEYPYCCACEENWRGRRCDLCESGLKLQDGCTSVAQPILSRISLCLLELAVFSHHVPIKFRCAEIRRDGESTSFVWVTSIAGGALMVIAVVMLGITFVGDMQSPRGELIHGHVSKWKSVATVVRAAQTANKVQP